MADPITTKFAVVDVERKEGEKNGRKWTVFNVRVATPEGVAGPPISTFSTTCGAKLIENKGKLLTFTIEPDTNKDGTPKVYSGVAVYKITRVLAEDGSTVLYEPGMDPGRSGGGSGGGGNQRPEWSYETAEERQSTRLSIEGQKSLDLTVQILVGIAPLQAKPPTLDEAVTFVRETFKEIAEDLGELSGSAAERSRSGSRQKGKSPRGADREQGQSASASGADNARPATPSLPERDPSPDLDPSADPKAYKAALLVRLDELLGSRAELIERVVQKYAKRTATTAELEVILAEATEEALTQS